MLYCTSFETIIGVIYVASSENGVCKISLTLESADEFRSWIKKHFDEHEVVENRLKNKDVIEQIKLYLARKLKKFELPIDLIGTDFQKIKPQNNPKSNAKRKEEVIERITN